MDEIAEELEHQEFMSECRALVEEIQWRTNFVRNDRQLKRMWDDVDVFGDEPVFTSILMDMLIAEDESRNEFAEPEGTS